MLRDNTDEAALISSSMPEAASAAASPLGSDAQANAVFVVQPVQHTLEGHIEGNTVKSAKQQAEEMPEHSISPMLSAETIQRRVEEMGAAITRDYPDASEPLMLVGVLKGATLFLADLARAINRDVEIDFVAVSSYGAATKSTGEVRVLKDLDTSVTNKHVIIVEDILDTGLTLRFSYLIETLRARHARSVKVCVLLDKPARRRVQVDVDYRGFEIEDKFVVGYGMDYAERYRNLRYIGVVTFDSAACGSKP